MRNPIKTLPRQIKTERLELRQLDANIENATLIFNAIKDENPKDFYFNPIVDIDIIPTSSQQMLQQMKLEEEFIRLNGVIFYVFYNNDLIEYKRLYFNNEDVRMTLQSSNIWLKKSAWGHGFSQEINKKIDEIAFTQLGAKRITTQCSTENTRSAKSLESSGFHLDGIARGGGFLPDGTVYDNMFWSKLESEYLGG